MKKTIAILALLVALAAAASAQSKSFQLGKWTEIQSAVLKELNRSYVDSLPVDRIERAGMDAMLANLDPYTIYIPKEENEDLQMMINKTYGGIGAIIFKPDKDGNVIINEPYEDSPAHKYGLVCGDEILSIDGVSTHGLTSAQCSEKMRGEAGTKVLFKVKKLRTGDTVDVTVVREKIHISDISYSGMIDAQTGYIAQTGFTEGVGEEIRKEIVRLKKEGMKKLILDLRGNGGGLLSEAVDIVSVFVPKGSLVVTAKGRSNGANYTCVTTKAPVDTKLPVVVLINSSSASASEIVAGALHDMDRATVMGQLSYGNGLVQSMRSLPYGGQLKITTAKYYTPSGRCVQAIDYSKRNEDGSVGHVPDSLTHEFKTAHGRTVRDGGGITPDVVLKPKEYSRLVYSVVNYGIVEEYALDYVRRHESIAAPDVFVFEDYEEFVQFAKTKEFDYRSGAKTYFDWMKEQIRKDGLEDAMKDELAALEKSLDMDKESFLRLKKDEIVPFIEQEIIVRYYFHKASVQYMLRYDDELRQALTSPLISY